MVKESFLFTIGAALSGSFASTLGKAAGDVKSLGREVESINKRRASVLNLGKLRTDRDAVEAKVTAAKAEREALIGRDRDTAEKLAALRKEQARMESLRKRGFEPVDPTARARVGDSIRDLVREQEAIRAAGEKNRKEAAGLGKEYAKLNFVLKATESRLVKAGVDVNNLSAAEAKLAAQSRRTALQLERDNRRLALDDAKSKFKGDLFGRFTVYKAVLAGTVGALSLMAKHTADASDADSSLADRIGMVTRELQEWQYAGTRNNMSIEETNGLLEKFTVRLQDAAHGGGEAGAALLRLGLDARVLAANGPDFALTRLADAFERIPSAGERALLATQLFGKEGVKLGAMLAGGTKELAKLRAEAHKVGFVMGDELVENGKRFDASQKRLGASLIGLRNIIGGALLPAFAVLSDAFTDYLIEHGEDFREIAGVLGQIMRGLVPTFIGLGKAVAWVGWAFAKTAGPVLEVLDNLGLLPWVLGAIAGFTMVRAVTNIVAMGRAMWGLVLAQRALNAGEAVSWATKAGRSWGALKYIGTTLKSFLPGIGASVTRALLPIVGGALKIGSVLLGAGETIAAFLGGIMTPIGWITAAFAAGFGIGTLLTKLEPVKRAMYAVGDGIWWVWEKITGLGDAFSKAFEKAKVLWDYLSGKKLFAWLSDKTEKAGYAIGDAISGLTGNAGPLGAALPAGGGYPMAVPSYSTSSKSVTVSSPVSITVNAGPKQSEEAIARRVFELAERKQRDASRSKLSD